MISLRFGALPGNVKLLLPPRQSRGNSHYISFAYGIDNIDMYWRAAAYADRSRI
jgi:hypothetical protein